ncbi:MAG: phosphatidate cytidylyltransferase [Bdellovibrionales bacterium]|nr:phosphatidate cytidylyltransferase [Bdellovibrionales bacterium]
MTSIAQKPYPALTKRLRTAAALILLSIVMLWGAAIGGIYAWGLIGFSYFFLIIVAAELVSTCALSPLHNTSFGSLVSKTTFIIGLLFTPSVLLMLRYDQSWFFLESHDHFMLPYMVVGGTISLFVCLLPIVFQTDTSIEILEKKVLERMIAVFFVAIGGGSFMALVSAEHATELYLWFIAVVAMNDSGAYFVGAKISSPPLSPVLSPKKTVLGSVGGLVFGVGTGILLVWILPLDLSQWSSNSWIFFIVGTTMLVLFAQLGDLLKSMLKRSHGIKDMSSLLPGHGGMLDRLDGILAACPYFLAFYLLLESLA